jgi:hypothetical protein
MLHVFPEVDSKHSESEWNQDSDNARPGMPSNLETYFDILLLLLL